MTDENGLSEPLPVEYVVEAIPPYNNFDEGEYPYNMSVCAQVEINNDGDIVFDSDEQDIVYAMYHNQCVGLAHVTVNTYSNSSDVYLTVYGKEDMNRKLISFQLWQASTGKIFGLTPSRDVLFAHGYVYGCGSDEPIVLSTNGSERQQIELSPGWNWTSINLDLHETGKELSTCMTATLPWTEGDLIKNPSTRQFSTYDETSDTFVGTLSTLHFSQMYMVYTAKGNTMRITGSILSEDSMHVSVRGNGQWSELPCLFDQRISVTEALADYYQSATPGDLIKARNRFATFSTDKRWVGDLTALQPGEGYLFRRMGAGNIDIAFHRQDKQANQRNQINQNDQSFDNMAAATNMTMIAQLEVDQQPMDNGQLMVYVGDELAAVATPIDSLYFLTIQSDKIGELRFELNGETLMPEIGTISYSADSHHGSLRAPIVLRKDDNRPYKIIENQRVVIIRNNEKYDVTGKKL